MQIMNVLDKIAETEMRTWLLECFEDDYDQEQISELSFEQLRSAVNRYFDGGYEGFLDCMLALEL